MSRFVRWPFDWDHELDLAIGHVTGSDDDEFEERAAIIEYEGGYSREEAERRARAELARARAQRKNESGR